jgi:minor fimbrial subunit
MMMKSIKITVMSTMVMGIVLASACIKAADPVTLNVGGYIEAFPCQVSSDSVTKSVDLGQNIQASDLQTAGSSTAWVPFTINLSSCPATTAVTIMTMHGTPDSDNPNDMYASTGTANNVAVQLQSQAADPLGDGKTIKGPVLNNAVIYELRARAYTQNGAVTPGTISSVITVTFTYT